MIQTKRQLIIRMRDMIKFRKEIATIWKICKCILSLCSEMSVMKVIVLENFAVYQCISSESDITNGILHK